jgi:ribosomal protein S12 methylthiotransferase
MLKAMNRGYDRKYLEALIAKLRKKMPSIAIRTTFIVGFPGETEKDFEDLKDFISKMKFDRVGVFPFSREKGTKAFDMKGQVREELKRGRAEALMKIQEKISREKNQGFVGKKMDVLIENENGGRSYRDAPEIDGKVFVKSRKELKPGNIIKVRIIRAGVHDLKGTPI